MSDNPQPLPLREVGDLAAAVVDAVGEVVVGKREPLELVLAGILAGGHVLMQDFPGLAKTLTARCFAQALGLEFNRLQFTPDLLPSDVTGSFLYNQKQGDFHFRPGPVFTNLLLADEINRTPPKTQAAMLEAMQEYQVSVEGDTHRLPSPFFVLATANPVEQDGTYPLPEAQLDRFLLRLSFGYPNRADESEVLRRRLSRKQEQTEVPPVVDAVTLMAMQSAMEDVAVENSIREYIVELVAATREHPKLQMGASPRGSLALLLLSRARAVLSRRDFVIPEDVKSVAVVALAHRISLKPELWLTGGNPEAIIGEICEMVPSPATTRLPDYGELPAPAQQQYQQSMYTGA